MALSSSPGSERCMQRLASGGQGSPTALATFSHNGSGHASPKSVSPVDQFLAAAAAAAAASNQQHHLAQLGSGGSGQLCGLQADTTTDGLCPTLPGLGSSTSCSSGAAGSMDEAPRKLAVLGLPWETT